jgi:hypothetical protein
MTFIGVVCEQDQIYVVTDSRMGCAPGELLPGYVTKLHLKDLRALAVCFDPGAFPWLADATCTACKGPRPEHWFLPCSNVDNYSTLVQTVETDIGQAHNLQGTVALPIMGFDYSNDCLAAVLVSNRAPRTVIQSHWFTPHAPYYVTVDQVAAAPSGKQIDTLHHLVRSTNNQFFGLMNPFQECLFTFDRKARAVTVIATLYPGFRTVNAYFPVHEAC